MIFMSIIIGFVLGTGEADNIIEIVWNYGLKWLVIAVLMTLAITAAKTAVSAWKDMWR